MDEWINDYFNTLRHLQLTTSVTDSEGHSVSLSEGFKAYIQYARRTRAQHTKIMFIGNGGSAGIASHMAIDYSKNGHLPALAFSDPSALTCLSNDYGYEHVFAKQIEYHARKGDFLVAISSSGKSINILNAIAVARKIGCEIATFSGFDPGNPLARLGDINFFVNSREYGFVEVAHLSLGHSLLDYMIADECRENKDHENSRENLTLAKA
jgi:D-sedoheptulose 7-phosphate isomerase